MSKDIKRLFIAVALILVIGLTVASVAVAQSQLEQRRCYEAGCVMWQNCPGEANCPRVAPAAASGCACC